MMRFARGLGIAVLLSVLAAALSACGGSTPSSGASNLRPRTIHAVETLRCAPGETVERDLAPNGYEYRCVAPNPAQPVSSSPDVQQGDRCPEFGATTYNRQGLVFDCEPDGPDQVNRWIRP